MGKRRLLLFSLLATLLFFLVLEGVLRLAVPRERLLFTWERANSPFTLLPSTGVLVPRAGQRMDCNDGPYPWYMVSNQQGFRELQDTPRRTPPGTRRILALGDSWMYGINVTQGKTLPDQLEQLLPARLGVDHVEVINAALPGSCAFDMLARWHTLADRLELDGILLGLPHNFERQRKLNDRRTSWYSSIKQAPIYTSGLLASRLYLVMRRLVVPFLQPRYAGEFFRQDNDKTAADDLANIAREGLARGFKVWAVSWPYHLSDVLKGKPLDDSMWRKRLEPMGVPVSGHALNSRECWAFLDHAHPGEAGQRALAEVVADTIATGKSAPAVREEPRCMDVPGIGPGKGEFKDWRD